MISDTEKDLYDKRSDDAVTAMLTLHSLMLSKLAERVLSRDERLEIAGLWEAALNIVVKNNATTLTNLPAEVDKILARGRKMVDNNRAMVMNVLTLD